MTTTNLITAAVTVDSATYAITLNSEGAVSISRDGVWSGDGRWDADARRIEDCPADLGEEVYEALEEALEDALEEADAGDTYEAVIASVLAQRPDFSREEVEAAYEGNPDLFDTQLIERVLARGVAVSRRLDELRWYVRSVDQGQMVEVSYAYDYSGGAYKRVFDRSDRTETLYRGVIDWDREEEGDDWEAAPCVEEWIEVAQ